MKIILVLVAIICLVVVSNPGLTGTDIGEKIVGDNGYMADIISTVDTVSSFFSNIANALVYGLDKVGSWFETTWNWVKNIFK